MKRDRRTGAPREELGALVAVEGVETEIQLAAALSAGAQPAQGELFAPRPQVRSGGCLSSLPSATLTPPGCR
ncbi:EAL domain-containing protein [Streptomyces sp. Ag109_O5-10]|uniref:EAL domain-containing protein n=1 Tax=Streptomyces sp. Ag109_O5-10 TaxID=1855349 RepID=UPI000B85756A|nr:EAL domain-containing protein [Streptomyces sp. Ag109_O5-10]